MWTPCPQVHPSPKMYLTLPQATPHPEGTSTFWGVHCVTKVCVSASLKAQDKGVAQRRPGNGGGGRGVIFAPSTVFGFKTKALGRRNRGLGAGPAVVGSCASHSESQHPSVSDGCLAPYPSEPEAPRPEACLCIPVAWCEKKFGDSTFVSLSQCRASGWCSVERPHPRR